MKVKLFTVVLAGLVVAAHQAKDDAVKKDIDKLQGTWSVTSLTVGGKEVPAEQFKEVRVLVKNNTYTVKVGEQVFEEGTFKVDPTRKPKTIDSTATTGENKGKTSQSIYEVEGDTLKVCSAPAGKDQRPKEFASKEGSEFELTIYKRVKK